MQERIEAFWQKKTFALFGLSRNKKSISHNIYNLLTRKGYTVFPINPHCDTIDSIKCYSSLDQIGQPVDAAILVTNPKISASIVKNCLEKGIKDIWFQYESADQELKAYCEQEGINYFYSCVLLHHKESPFPHSLHRFFYRLFKR